MPAHAASDRGRRLLGWFTAGALLALAAQFYFVLQSEDRWAGLLRVGSENPLLPQMEAELGPLHPQGAIGHDGQISYVIARDPFNRHDTAGRMRELDQAPYRYRRILYSLLAGGFGLLPGVVTLAGLVLLAGAGVGLGTAAVADIGDRLALPGWPVPASLLNLGVLLAAVLLTSDALALGLGLVGIALLGRGYAGRAMLILALAALTKETYLLFAWAAGLWLWLEVRRGLGLAMAMVPTAVLAAWSLFVFATTGELAPGLHHFVIPGTGIVEAVPVWLASSPVAVTFVAGAGLALVVLASLVAAMRTRDRLLAICCAAWAILGLVLSVNVWEVPTNALRVLAPVWPLALLAVASLSRGRRPTAA